MTEQSQWVQITQADPEHSARYAERFRALAAQGADLAGEARLVDAFLPRGA
ncbi:SAM-dependent methyltransferase, partial [Modestobacter sp. VKM Ac-2676]